MWRFQRKAEFNSLDYRYFEQKVNGFQLLAYLNRGQLLARLPVWLYLEGMYERAGNLVNKLGPLIFPIAPEVVEKIQIIIDLNPEEAERRGILLAECIEDNDPLESALEELTYGREIDFENEPYFIDGFLIGVKALRLQLGYYKHDLPEVTVGTARAYLDQLSMNSETGDQWMQKIARSLIEQKDPFMDVIATYIRNMEQPTENQTNHVLFGCFSAYDFIKYQVELADFNTEFSS